MTEKTPEMKAMFGGKTMDGFSYWQMLELLEALAGRARLSQPVSFTGKVLAEAQRSRARGEIKRLS